MGHIGARRLAVVGGGWAGIAAAVRGVQAGHAVTLLEMAPQLGGRARRIDTPAGALDNGQHILIGAYTRTLALMQTVGAPVQQGLLRRPLELRYPDGRGMASPGGHPVLGFARAVAGCVGWNWADRLALLRTAFGWALRGYRCPEHWTVDHLCQGLPKAVRELLIDPLCVAALNTPAPAASASVFLRVLHDALFGGPGSADLLLPRHDLGRLLPDPAAAWLTQHGATLRLRQRVQALDRHGDGWAVDGEAFDAVVLACSPTEAARLASPVAPAWAEPVAAMPYEPIVTVWLQAGGARLPAPMTALVEGDDAPAQFAFDHGALGLAPGRFAFVVSGARRWLERGTDATAQAVQRQAAQGLAAHGWPPDATVLQVTVEKRATFRCVPGLARASAVVAPALVAAGDHVAGPYPATLEGAVRSGEAAIAQLEGSARPAA